MRYLYVGIAMLFMFTTAAMAEEGQDAATQVQGKEIDVDYNDSRPGDDGARVGVEREMPQDQTYDENTGLPNVVESDKAGELE